MHFVFNARSVPMRKITSALAGMSVFKADKRRIGKIDGKLKNMHLEPPPAPPVASITSAYTMKLVHHAHHLQYFFPAFVEGHLPG